MLAAPFGPHGTECGCKLCTNWRRVAQILALPGTSEGFKAEALKKVQVLYGELLDLLGEHTPSFGSGVAAPGAEATPESGRKAEEGKDRGEGQGPGGEEAEVKNKDASPSGTKVKSKDKDKGKDKKERRRDKSRHRRQPKEKKSEGRSSKPSQPEKTGTSAEKSPESREKKRKAPERGEHKADTEKSQEEKTEAEESKRSKTPVRPKEVGVKEEPADSPAAVYKETSEEEETDFDAPPVAPGARLKSKSPERKGDREKSEEPEGGRSSGSGLRRVPRPPSHSPPARVRRGRTPPEEEKPVDLLDRPPGRFEEPRWSSWNNWSQWRWKATKNKGRKHKDRLRDIAEHGLNPDRRDQRKERERW